MSCETINISQVKHPSDRCAYGSIIAVTGRAIAYVLNGKKIRFIAQENASMGLMDAHDPARLPVVDLAWCGQNEPATTGDLNVPASNLLASLTKGAEVRVGAVFSDSNTSLAYEGLFASIFPELAPARGLAWGSLQGVPLLAVFGEDTDVFLVLLQSTGPKVVYVSTDMADIRAVYLDSARETLLVASLLKVETFAVSDLDDISRTSSTPLSEGSRDVFLLAMSQGPAVATLSSSGSQLVVKRLGGERPGPSLSFALPTRPVSSVFVRADPVTDVLCVGYQHSDIIHFLKTDDGAGTVASGTWPNNGSVISVCSSGQLHSVYKSSRKTQSAASAFFLYVYSQDSVKMHHFEIDWSKGRREGPEAMHATHGPRSTRSLDEESLSRASGILSPRPPQAKTSTPSPRLADPRPGLHGAEDVSMPSLLERSFDKLAVSLASDLDKVRPRCCPTSVRA